MNNLRDNYKKVIKKKLFKEFKYKSVMQVPKIEKIVLNMTVGSDVSNSSALDEVVNNLTIISGQKPIYTKAKKSLASWKLRQGMPIGAKVTLRRDRMWFFLDKLISIVIPRIRDFRGISRKSFDGRGNFAFGIKEHIIFPEIKFDKIKKIRGLDVIIITTAKTDKEALALLSNLGMPFKGKERN